jgi:phosphoribosylanthranilate isomerase
VKIKICGLTRPEDIDAVNAARPDYIGFVFARRSRRRVSFEQAAELRARLDDGITPVGVFTDADAEEIAGLAARGVIGMAQLHGDENAEYIAKLRGLLAATATAYVPIIKAVTTGALRTGVAEDVGGRPDYFLIDHGDGGTGEAFDWNELRGLHRDGLLYVPAPHGQEEKCVKLYVPLTHGCGEGDAPGGGLPFFLAGGVNEDNIEAALDVGPYGVDVSSGAETDGVKDAEKIARLVAAVRKRT